MIVFEKHFGNEIRIHDDVCPTLGERLGTGGGNFPMIVDTLVFDNAQITSKLNYSHPTWGGQCHPLTSAAGQAVVVIKREETDELSESDRLFKPRGASR